MYPHERSLVKKMEGKPFALIGVNSDRTRDIAKKAAVDNQLTWRSFYAGQGGGKAAATYQLEGWPTLYLIDAKGVVRRQWAGAVLDDRIEKEVEKLLAEMEKAP
jgi:hypothetical protein